MSFIECSKNALKEYWRTAVVIDDAPQIKNYTQANSLSEPPRRVRTSQTEQASEFTGAELNVSALVTAFLNLDILCTVLNNKEVLTNKAEALLRSDILVLDWKFDDEGELAASFIKNCISSHPNALHMICIYTAESNLEAIHQKLEEVSKNLNEIPGREGAYCVGSTYILVVQKYRSPISQRLLSAEPENLPNLLLEEFAILVGGLLRNAVFHSIGAIRKNTHVLLDCFNPNLDPAFVSHRVCSNPSEDTEQHIIPMISSQINSILAQECIPKQLNFEKIKI